MRKCCFCIQITIFTTLLVKVLLFLLFIFSSFFVTIINNTSIINNDVVRHYFILGKTLRLTTREVLCSWIVIGRDGIDYKQMIGQYGSGHASLSNWQLWRRCYLTGYFTRMSLKHADRGEKQFEGKKFELFLSFWTKVSTLGVCLFLAVGGHLTPVCVGSSFRSCCL